MKTMEMVISAVLVAGCTGTGGEREDLSYQRETERIEAVERYQEFRRECARSGGIVYVDRHFGGRLAPEPSVDELKSAYCGRPIRGATFQPPGATRASRSP